MRKLRALLIFGTRPEAVKLAPVLDQCRRRAQTIEPLVCLTGQHGELLEQAIEYFGIRPDVDLGLMTPNQALAGLTARCVERLDEVLGRLKPDCVVAQGDTTSTMAASLAAFYRRIPLVHVEAGLRTGNLQAPWPEELNRRIADMVAALHCAPTRRAADALLAEGLSPETVHVTGNTAVDALLQTIRRQRDDAEPWQQKYAVLGQQRMVLITSHRRESFGGPLENDGSPPQDTGGPLQNICRAVAALAAAEADCRFVWPVHLNPNVWDPVHRLLDGRANVHLIPPVAYPEFVWLMDRSTLILTDSGGVQEEAPSLGKPVLVMRDVTERPEAVEAGAARLVGTTVEAIVEATRTLLHDPTQYAACRVEQNPYGDGHAAERIVKLMLAQDW